MTTSQEFLAAGLTYRELDYWTTQGYLHAAEPNPGSGARREWAPIELDIARTITRLRSAGVISIGIAAKVARDYAMSQLVALIVAPKGGTPLPVGPIEIAPGISILIAEVLDGA